MSTKKTIQINPELFKLSSNGNKTRKNREKKELTLTPIVSPNKLKTKLLKRIQDFKKNEVKSASDKRTTSDKSSTTPTNNSKAAANDEFYGAIEFLQKKKKDVEKENNQKVKWTKLFRYKQTWSFSIGKFLTDGVWWFFLFWLPAYLKEKYGMSATEMALPLVVLYSMVMVGSIAGGWFPAYFVKKGMNVYEGRLKAMFVIALFPLVVLAAQPLGYMALTLRTR